MTKTELLEIINNRENSGVEFKRDDVQNYELAKELVCFLNLDGGMLLLGVEDDGTISGTTRESLEEWVAELSRIKIDPPIVPHLAWMRDIEPGKDILVVRVPQGPDKPYSRVHNDRKTYFIRVGSTCREASREELERMFQASGRVQYGLKPVPGASLNDLDHRRLRDYFERVLGGSIPSSEDVEKLQKLLCNLDLMINSSGQFFPTIDGMLLFGKNPKRYLPQSGIRALSYPGATPDYATRSDIELKGSLLPLYAADDSLIESGLVEQAIDFVMRNTEPKANIENGKRINQYTYPLEVIRETIVNALVHRDYSIIGSDITLTVFADRLEIQSPGRLPNTVTVDGMKAGYRYARNQTLVNIMRDYRYVEFRGMGIRDKIIPGMLHHNNTEPELIATENYFILRLWKEKKQS